MATSHDVAYFLFLWIPIPETKFVFLPINVRPTRVPPIHNHTSLCHSRPDRSRGQAPAGIQKEQKRFRVKSGMTKKKSDMPNK